MLGKNEYKLSSYGRFLVEKAIRIDVRYYLVKVNNSWYIIDYSNPKNIRNYFPGLFPKVLTEWKIYHISDEKNRDFLEKNLVKKIMRRNKSKVNWFVLFAIVYILHCVLFPKDINIAYLTYDSRIAQNWPLVVSIILLFLLVIVLCLISLKQTKLPINGEQALILKQINTQNIEVKWYLRWFMKLPNPIRWGISMMIFIPIFFFIGIGGSSYSQLLVFAILPVYSIFLGKFISFLPMKDNRKYQIIENNRK